VVPAPKKCVAVTNWNAPNSFYDIKTKTERLFFFVLLSDRITMTWHASLDALSFARPFHVVQSN